MRGLGKVLTMLHRVDPVTLRCPARRFHWLMNVFHFPALQAITSTAARQMWQPIDH